jgi:hypothetical protein
VTASPPDRFRRGGGSCVPLSGSQRPRPACHPVHGTGPDPPGMDDRPLRSRSPVTRKRFSSGRVGHGPINILSVGVRGLCVELGSKQHDRDGNGLLGSGCSGRPGHRARAFGPREREHRGGYFRPPRGFARRSCMPPRPENRARLRGAPPDLQHESVSVGDHQPDRQAALPAREGHIARMNVTPRRAW